MKRVLILLLFQSTLMVTAQTGIDTLNQSEIYLVRTDSIITSQSIKFYKLKINDIGKLFGNDYTSRIIYADLIETNYTKIIYDDGLILNFPELPAKMEKGFEVRSDKYTLILQNGRKIKVGMKADDLRKIFPNSFLPNHRINGKPMYNVNFTLILNGKLQFMSSWITFILSGEDGVLKEFHTWEAG